MFGGPFGGGGPGGPGGGPGGGGGGGGRGRGGLHGALDSDEIELGKLYDAKVISRLPRYLAPVKRYLMLGGAGTLVRTVSQVALPYLIGRATDQFIQSGNLGGLTVISLIIVGIMLLMWGGEYVSTLYLAYAGQSVLYRMRTEMFDHLQNLSLSFFDHNKVGKLMSRVQNDVNQLQEVITNGVLNIIASLLTLVFIAAVMIIMNPVLALLTFTVVPVMIIIVAFWQKYARQAFVRVRQAIAIVNDQLQESISGVRVVQSLSREDVNAEKFDGVNKAHLDANITAVKLQAFMMPTVQIMTAVAYGVLIIRGGADVLAGTLSVGVLLSFLLYIQRFFEPVLLLTMQYTEVQRAMASGNRIFELLDVKPAIQDKPDAIEMPPIKGEVEFDNLRFSYDPETEVLHGISLKFHPGEMIAIVGRTGAGKSSLMNLVARFYEASDGAVRLDGYNVKDVTRESLRRQIGIVPQDAFLFSGTIEDNIRYGKLEATRDEVIEAARAAGVHEFIENMEHGYDTQAGERGHNLSAGQRQLVCLARVILADPPIIILDEATSNVDTNTEKIMQDSLRRVSQGRTLLVIAHRLSTITSADRIIVLQRGDILEMGNHEQLLASRGFYYQMFETLSALEPE